MEFQIFPESWKKGTVVPLPKKDNVTQVTDLRPISLLPLPGKHLERLLCDRLVRFLEMNNILVPAQHGFRKGRSTISAINALLNDVYNNRNNTSPTYLVFLDLTKAFDSLSHELLLSKLKETGISIEFCKWMESYIANRVQRVKLNNSVSPYTAIKYRVPQGSVLGPILFSIYIINLGLLLDNIQIYADDAVIYIYICSTDLMDSAR